MMNIIEVENIPIFSQPRFRMYLYEHDAIKAKFMKELELNFSDAKEEYKKSKK